jgi:catechol 2,3-dioxygenase-like lactoylglutathione lyase family enzyme
LQRSRGLTIRSRLRAPAWHLARESLWFIIRLAAQAPFRRAPINSIVRPLTGQQFVSYEHPRLSFAITLPRKVFAGEIINHRKPGALHHLAFRVSSPDAVDRLHLALKAIGAAIVSRRQEIPEYTPAGYYALYFKDPEGIKYEIVCTDDSRMPAPNPSLQPTSGGQSG